MRRNYIGTKGLRQQVIAEKKKKNLFFFSVIAIAFLYIIISSVFGERGLIKYYELKKTENALKTEIQNLQKGNEQLRKQIDSLNKDSFLKEKYARENFGLAKPEEYIYQFKDNEK